MIGARLSRERVDEKVWTHVAVARDPGVGAEPTKAAREAGDNGWRARRQLCADRPNRQWRTGLFDEMRQSPGAATAAAGPANPSPTTPMAPIPRTTAAGPTSARNRSAR